MAAHKPMRAWSQMNSARAHGLRCFKTWTWMVGLQTCVYVYSNRNDLMPVLKHTSLTRMAISINLISRSSCIHRLHFEILHNYCTASDKHAVVSLLFSLLFFCSADAQSSALLQHSISSAIKQVIYCLWALVLPMVCSVMLCQTIYVFRHHASNFEVEKSFIWG